MFFLKTKTFFHKKNNFVFNFLRFFFRWIVDYNSCWKNKNSYPNLQLSFDLWQEAITKLLQFFCIKGRRMIQNWKSFCSKYFCFGLFLIPLISLETHRACTILHYKRIGSSGSWLRFSEFKFAMATLWKVSFFWYFDTCS